MFNIKRIEPILHELENNDGEFIVILEKIIKAAIRFIQNTDDLREELMEQNEIFQVYIEDINFNFWIKANNSSIIYKRGVNEDSTLRIKITKDLVIKIIKQEVSGTDAYMKGLIKASGTLTQALKLRNIGRVCVKYINNIRRNT